VLSSDSVSPSTAFCQGPLFSVFFVFVITLGLFPGVTVNMSSQSPDSMCWCVVLWPCDAPALNTLRMFPVVIFSAFNIGDTCGRITSGRSAVVFPRFCSPRIAFIIIVCTTGSCLFLVGNAIVFVIANNTFELLYFPKQRLQLNIPPQLLSLLT
jgi:hypothetical protein